MTYRIIDEPAPSGLSRYIVNPFWPLLGSMFGGAWLAWPWFLLNSLAFGRGRRFDVDLAWLSFGLALNAGSVMLVAKLLEAHVIEQRMYADLLPQAARLTLLYVVFLRQQRTFQLFEHFGGVGRNGLLVVFIGGALRGQVLAHVPPLLRSLLG
ncbi:MAG: hypothetical protein QM756_07465 [Polyangiaceae bacterium]